MQDLNKLLISAREYNTFINEQLQRLEDAYQNGDNIISQAQIVYEQSSYNPALAGALIEPFIWQEHHLDPTFVATVRSLLSSLIELQPYNVEAWCMALMFEKRMNSAPASIKVLGENAIAKAKEKIEEILRLMS